MQTFTDRKPDYGNWVSPKFIYGPAALGILFLALSIFFRPSLILAAIFLLISAYFAYARYLFSSGGGSVQDQIWDLVPAHLDWNGAGRALDVGCGNGALTIRLACKHPAAQLVGIDYWGSNWAYSQGVCRHNADLEGVGSRVTFQKASASALPFEDGYFDAVVSNLAFHEVADATDKRMVIREALRVSKRVASLHFRICLSSKPYMGMSMICSPRFEAGASAAWNSARPVIPHLSPQQSNCHSWSERSAFYTAKSDPKPYPYRALPGSSILERVSQDCSP